MIGWELGLMLGFSNIACYLLYFCLACAFTLLSRLFAICTFVGSSNSYGKRANISAGVWVIVISCVCPFLWSYWMVVQDIDVVVWMCQVIWCYILGHVLQVYIHWKYDQGIYEYIVALIVFDRVCIWKNW